MNVTRSFFLACAVAAAIAAQACAAGSANNTPIGAAGDDGGGSVASGTEGGTGPGAGDGGHAGDGGDSGYVCGTIGEPCCGENTCHAGLFCAPTGVCVASPAMDSGGGDDASDSGGGQVPDAPPSCSSPGEAMCGGSCTDTTIDPHNCGGCGHDCLGDACTNGTCPAVALSSEFVPPGRLVIDATSAYWTNGDGTIRSAPLAGGGTTTTIAQGLSSPRGIAVDAQNAYAVSQDGRIVSAPLAGGGMLTVLAMGQPQPYALTADANDVYWTTIGSGAGNGTVMACAKTGCNQMPTTLTSGIHVQYPYGMAVASGTVYWTSFNFTGELNSVPTTGGAMKTVATGLGYPYQVALSGSTAVTVLYGQGGGIATVPATGGMPTDIIGGQSFPTEGATDGKSAYWTLTIPSAEMGATLVKCGLDGSNRVVLATGVQPAGSVAVDAQWVYWLSNDGTVLKTAK